jgi:hypothetical protein
VSKATGINSEESGVPSMRKIQMPTTQTARLVLAATILGSSMAFLDGTVVNLALPTFQETFGANVSVVQSVVEACALSTTLAQQAHGQSVRQTVGTL